MVASCIPNFETFFFYIYSAIRQQLPRCVSSGYCMLFFKPWSCFCSFGHNCYQSKYLAWVLLQRSVDSLIPLASILWLPETLLWTWAIANSISSSPSLLFRRLLISQSNDGHAWIEVMISFFPKRCFTRPHGHTGNMFILQNICMRVVKALKNNGYLCSRIRAGWL